MGFHGRKESISGLSYLTGFLKSFKRGIFWQNLHVFIFTSFTSHCGWSSLHKSAELGRPLSALHLTAEPGRPPSAVDCSGTLSWGLTSQRDLGQNIFSLYFNLNTNATLLHFLPQHFAKFSAVELQKKFWRKNREHWARIRICKFDTTSKLFGSRL